MRAQSELELRILDMVEPVALIFVDDAAGSGNFLLQPASGTYIVNNADVVYPPESLDRVYERVRIDAQGKATWLSPQLLHTPPMSEEVSITVTRGSSEAILACAARMREAKGQTPAGIVGWRSTITIGATSLSAPKRAATSARIASKVLLRFS
mgnify:CR=1 FL=1